MDVETLEPLEELLTEYQGTLLLVSHDREFLDNVVCSTLVLEGEGRVGDYVGGYSDWLRQRPAARAIEVAPTPATPVETPRAPEAEKPKRKLSYKDQRELEQLPARIEQLETEVAERSAAMNQPQFYQQDNAAIQRHNDALAKIQTELEVAYARWAELEG